MNQKKDTMVAKVKVKTYPLKSELDSIIIDLILDHFNIQSLKGRKGLLSSNTFDRIVEEAEEIYIKKIIMEENPGVA